MTSDNDSASTSPRGSVADDLPKKELENKQQTVEEAAAVVSPDIEPKQQQQQKAISFDEKQSPMLIRKERSRKTRPAAMDRSRSHQETLTKDEARKRMLSWRKTTRPRVSMETR